MVTLVLRILLLLQIQTHYFYILNQQLSQSKSATFTWFKTLKSTFIYYCTYILYLLLYRDCNYTFPLIGVLFLFLVLVTLFDVGTSEITAPGVEAGTGELETCCEFVHVSLQQNLGCKTAPSCGDQQVWPSIAKQQHQIRNQVVKSVEKVGCLY